MKTLTRQVAAFTCYLKLVSRVYTKAVLGLGQPRGLPTAPWCNAVLKSQAEWKSAMGQADALGLPRHADPYKNWDSLAMLDFILRYTDCRATVLDAGAAVHSAILPWLFLYGYENLTGININFKRRFRIGPIRYEHGDLIRTRFSDNTFDVVVCQSVIEHGVDLAAYFKEMSRILKPEGFLITSTDYNSQPMDIQGKMRYGVPVRIFSREGVLSALDLAYQMGFHSTGTVDLSCHEKPVHWLGLDFTFLIFVLQKK